MTSAQWVWMGIASSACRRTEYHLPIIMYNEMIQTEPRLHMPTENPERTPTNSRYRFLTSLTGVNRQTPTLNRQIVPTSRTDSDIDRPILTGTLEWSRDQVYHPLNISPNAKSGSERRPWPPQRDAKRRARQNWPFTDPKTPFSNTDLRDRDSDASAKTTPMPTKASDDSG